jgi:hypothetical protein
MSIQPWSTKLTKPQQQKTKQGDYEHEQKRATTATTGKANTQLLFNMVIYTLRFTIIPLCSQNHSHTYT